MAVGVLLLTHPHIGGALVASVEAILRGNLPLRLAEFEVPFEADPDALLPQASAAMRRVDAGDGVLILSDVYGATPSNLAARLSRLGTPSRRVSGVSLPMLLRVMNYAELPLEELPAVAAAGARNGVILDDA